MRSLFSLLLLLGLSACGAQTADVPPADLVVRGDHLWGRVDLALPDKKLLLEVEPKLVWVNGAARLHYDSAPLAAEELPSQAFAFTVL